MISTTDNKFHLSKEGLAKAKQEYEKLLEFKKAKTKGEVPAIWHSEDVNPEYIAFQEDLSILESRLAEYEEILKNAELIKLPPKEKRKEVHLGARVIIGVDNGRVDEFEIVGTLEANPSVGKISNESPVGKALLGHRAGEKVSVSSPKETILTIRKIRYRP